jgi:molecular chaperone Hsp33
MPHPDTVVRAITEDGSFRVIAATTTDTVRGVLQAQRAEGATARYLADLVSGTILLRETMAPNLRLQALLQGSGGTLAVDAHPDGRTRGLVGVKPGREFDLASGGMLRVMRTLPSGRVHEGVVGVAPGSTVSEALMTYMQQSEQVLSTLGVASAADESGPHASAGYVVQLLPEVDRGALFVMTARLEDLDLRSLIAGDASARTLLDELLFGMEHTQLQHSTLSFGCTCNHAKVVASIATLGREEITDVIVKGETLDVECDYCRRAYRVEPSELVPLLGGVSEA